MILASAGRLFQNLISIPYSGAVDGGQTAQALVPSEYILSEQKLQVPLMNSMPGLQGGQGLEVPDTGRMSGRSSLQTFGSIHLYITCV